MASLEDIESTNALEWDDVGIRCQPSNTQGVTTRGPRQARAVPMVSLGHSPYHESMNGDSDQTFAQNAKQQGAPASMTKKTPFSIVDSLPPVAPGSPADNIASRPQMQELARSASSLSREQRNQRKNGYTAARTEAGKSKLSTKWASHPQLLTDRKRVQESNEADQRDKKTLFIGHPPSELMLQATGAIDLIDIEIDTDMIFRQLDIIRKTCEVYISYDEQKKSLVLRASHSPNIGNATKKINLAIDAIKAEYASFLSLKILVPPLLLRSHIHPPTATSNKKVSWSSQVVSGKDALEWKEKRSIALNSNHTRFFDHIKTLLLDLKALQSGLRMRAHFGYVELSNFPRPFLDSGCSYQKFVEMISNNRTIAVLNKNLGNLSFAAQVLQKIEDAPHLFSPTDISASRLDEVKPQYLLLVHSTAREMVRLEAEIDDIDNSFQVGSTYFFLENERQLRMNVCVLDLETDCDWSLEIVSEKTVSKDLKILGDMVYKCLSGNLPQETARHDFPYPRITLQVPTGIVINQVQVESSFQYNLKNSPYRLEIALVRKWGSANTTEFPLIECRISLHHPEWDVLMGSRGGAGYDWEPGEDLDTLFPDHNDKGFLTFLAVAQQVKAFLESIQDCTGRMWEK